MSAFCSLAGLLLLARLSPRMVGRVKRSVELALHTWPHKSQQEIAAQVGCNVSTVCRVKDNLPMQNIPPTRTDSLGRTRPTSYATRRPRIATPEEEARRGCTAGGRGSKWPGVSACDYAPATSTFADATKRREAGRGKASKSLESWLLRVRIKRYGKGRIPFGVIRK